MEIIFPNIVVQMLRMSTLGWMKHQVTKSFPFNTDVSSSLSKTKIKFPKYCFRN